MNQLINQLFFRHFGNEILLRGEDAALLPVSGPVAFTTDSFTVSPLFFEGGDIGKLAIPLEILEKPAALTPEELSQIQQHAETSLDLLGSIPGFTCVRDWGGRHHERLDGTGYPHGIRGAKLSLPMRIIAVADVFTALTEDRPYRAGMPLAKAMEIIESMAELCYLDANVVALLADNVLQVNRARIRAQRRAAANFVVMRRLCGDSAGAA